MFWQKNKEPKISKEISKKINEQKESCIASYLALICKKKYDENWNKENELKVVVSLLKLHPDIYEALYEHSYQKLNQFLNDNGTGNKDCEFWKEII